MGGRKVINRMKLKGYIEMELQKLEEQSRTQIPSYDTTRLSYIQGKIDALKWVLSKES